MSKPQSCRQCWSHCSNKGLHLLDSPTGHTDDLIELAESSHLRIKPLAFPAEDQKDVVGLVLGVDATILYFTLPTLLCTVTSRSSHPSWSSLNPVGLRVFDQQQVAEATSKPFPSPDFKMSCTLVFYLGNQPSCCMHKHDVAWRTMGDTGSRNHPHHSSDAEAESPCSLQGIKDPDENRGTAQLNPHQLLTHRVIHWRDGWCSEPLIWVSSVCKQQYIAVLPTF